MMDIDKIVEGRWNNHLKEGEAEINDIELAEHLIEEIVKGQQEKKMGKSQNSNSTSRCVICGRTIDDGFPACTECRNSKTFNNL